MKTPLLLLLSIIGCLSRAALHGQALPLFPQHAEHATLINPAAMPVENQLDEASSTWKAWVSHRNQWATRDGPKYLAGRFDWTQPRANRLSRWAAGAHVLWFETGPATRYALAPRLAFRQKLSDQWRLCVGIAPGILAMQTDIAQLALLHPNDPALAALPPTLTQGTLGAGFFVYQRQQGGGSLSKHNKNSLWAGASMPQVAVLSFRRADTLLTRPGWLRSPFYATAGWHRTLAEPGNARPFVEPTFWLKTERDLPLVAQAALKSGFEWQNGRVQRAWLCAGYTWQAEMLHTECGFDWKIGDRYTARTVAVYNRFFEAYRSAFPSAFELGVAVLHRK